MDADMKAILFLYVSVFYKMMVDTSEVTKLKYKVSSCGNTALDLLRERA